MKRTKLYIRDSLLAFVCGQVERYEDEANVGVDAAHGTCPSLIFYLTLNMSINHVLDNVFIK